MRNGKWDVGSPPFKRGVGGEYRFFGGEFAWIIRRLRS